MTAKALIAGTLIGILCSFLALYYSLKTGVIPSLNILSGLGGFLLVKLFLRLGIFRGTFTPQENAIIQTVSVAVYAMSSVGIGFGSSYLGMSYNAYLALGPEYVGNRPEDTFELTFGRNILWCLALGFFGFFLAFPLRDYTIIEQNLPFPSGTVTAYVIKNMHQIGSSTTTSFAILSKFFSISFCVNMVTWAFRGLDSFPIFGGYMKDHYTWAMDFDIGSFGIGAILPIQITFSMLLGAVMSYGIMQPYIEHFHNGSGPNDWVDMENLPGKSAYLGLMNYSIFSGLAIMLVCGVWTIGTLIVTLVKEWRKPKTSNEKKHKEIEDGIRSQTEVLNDIFKASTIPKWVPYAGYTVFSIITVVMLHFIFHVRWYQTLVAIAIIPVFAISNVQAMGRTDWDVSSAYGKIMMFPFGVWNFGGSILPSLALCSVTISGCSNAASLLQDFKTGQLLGCSPNKMFIAQFFGAVVGAFVTPVLFLLLSSAFELPTDDKQAFIQGRYGVIYRTLAVVATGNGFDALPSKLSIRIEHFNFCVAENVLYVALGFGLLALLLNILHVTLDEKYVQYLPEASSLSIGVLVQPAVSLEFFIGSLLVWWWSKWNSNVHKQVPYIASGAVAGSGIAVVCRSFLSLFGIQAPMEVQWSEVPQALNAGQWIGAMIFIAIFLGFLGCGLWFWNQVEERESQFTDTLA